MFNTIHLEKVNSTNTYLKENYQNLPSFTFVRADYKTDGKGSNDRKWLSNDKDNLLFSLLIKEKNVIEKFNVLSLGVAFIIARCLENLGLDDVSIKWPNDVYVKGRKICGILLEGSIPEYVVIGIGINVNQTTFPCNLRTPATSIGLEFKREIDINPLFEDLTNDLYSFITTLNENISVCEDFIQKHNYLLGKRVKVADMVGKVVGLSKDFSLLLDVDGKIKTISSGEIEIIFTK